MRLLSYQRDGQLRPGIQAGDVVFDTRDLAGSIGLDADSLRSNRQVLALGSEGLRQLEDAAGVAGHEALELAALTLGPPVPDPDKVIGIALNYHDHAAETGMPLPAAPPLFAKFSSSLVGPMADVLLPPNSEKVDYEAELAIVIGTRCKHVAAADAATVIAGAMAFNDVSARDLQGLTTQLTGGKALDTFGPCGPALVTSDELGNLDALELGAKVNGETVQQSTTAQMIFSTGELVAFISSLMTLEPGDIIATGTPGGVGARRNPPRFLADGDIVEVFLGGVGSLRNRFVNDTGGMAPGRG